MKRTLMILAMLLSACSATANACTKHDSYDAWFKKGLIKIEKDGSLTCEAKTLGIKNCADAMPYIYNKYKKKARHDQHPHTH